ncbi:MAG TPA: hypothetical protein IAA05_13465 [Candidatus Blautia excrementipullorum]|nr:hypothetical protein [Candidatus Blautia excrementipullorum]
MIHKISEKSKNEAEINSSLWISEGQKCLLFHSEPGYKKIIIQNSDEMWDCIRHFVNTGYKVG